MDIKIGKLHLLPGAFLTAAVILLANEKVILLTMASALIHEFGHIITLKLFGKRIIAICAGTFGLNIVTDHKMISYPKECIISASGPLMNLLSALLGVLFLKFCKSTGDYYFIGINLLYFIINMLPIRALDGGQLLYNAVSLVLNTETAENVLSATTAFFMIVLAAISTCIVLFGNGNLSAMAVCFYLIVFSCKMNKKGVKSYRLV